MGYYLLDVDYDYDEQRKIDAWYDSLPKMLEFDETEKVICNRFKDVDFQFNCDKTAEIIFSADFLNNPDGNKKTTLHWYWVGEVLKEKYKYVAMERLDKNYNPIEAKIQKEGYSALIDWTIPTFEKMKKIDVSHFKFIIWKSVFDYYKEYDRNLRQYFDF